MGALTTIALVPNLIFSLHAGSWVDRRAGRRQVMLVTDVCRGAPDRDRSDRVRARPPDVAAPLHRRVRHGHARPSSSTSRTAASSRRSSRREDYVAANSLSHGSRAFSFLAGTSLGGVLVQLLRGPYALALDAVSYLWSAFFIGRVDAPDPPHGAARPGGVLAGARWIRGNAIIRAELLGVATLNLFNFIYFALFLLYATRSLHVRPGDARRRARRRVDRDALRLGRDRTHLATDRRRACVPDRLLPLPRAARSSSRRPAARTGSWSRCCSRPSSSPASASCCWTSSPERFSGRDPAPACARASRARSWS